MPAPIFPSASAQTQSAPIQSAPIQSAPIQSAPIQSAKENADADDEQDWQGLPPGKGREETFYLCAPCHSLKLVTQQGLSAQNWNEAIDWMVDEQEMPALEPDERTSIVDYLAKFYGEDRKARGGRKRRR